MSAWVCLAWSQVIWLFHDVSFGRAAEPAPQSDFLLALEEGLRAAAIAFVFIAGLAQRRALRRNARVKRLTSE